MKDVMYFAPTGVGEALNLLAEHGENALILAGGTDIVPKINYYELKPDVLIYIGAIVPSHIREDNGKLIIGAGTTWSSLAVDPLIVEKAGILSEAARQGSCTAIRNTGTIGGNLANASPAADLATPLLVMDAELVLKNSKGERLVLIKDFFIGPGETVLKTDELIVEIRIPIFKGNTAFLKVGRRKAMTLSVVNTAVRITMEDMVCKKVRIALGSMAPTPMRCIKAEKMLEGKPVDGTLIRKCAGKAITETSPIDDQRATAWYRKKAGENLVARALAQAAGFEE